MSTKQQVQELAPLRIRVLGRITVHRPDGSSVRGALWGRTKVRCLFALLLMHEHHYLHRDEIIQELWPDIPRKAALANLNNTVYSLRKCLEPDLESGSASQYICYQRGGYYALSDHQPRWLDMCCFQALLREARTTTAILEPKPLYEKAIGLYRGDLLTDLDPIFARFEYERSRLRMLYCEAMENLAILHVYEEQFDEAMTLYLKILETYPGRDTVATRLIHLSLQQDNLPLKLAIINLFQKIHIESPV